jgi:hypothetical protein
MVLEIDTSDTVCSGSSCSLHLLEHFLKKVAPGVITGSWIDPVQSGHEVTVKTCVLVALPYGA